MKQDTKVKNRKDDPKSQRRNDNKQSDCKNQHKAPPDGAAVRKEPGVE